MNHFVLLFIILNLLDTHTLLNNNSSNSKDKNVTLGNKNDLPTPFEELMNNGDSFN